MITMNSANMTVWLTPSMISGNASGMRTFHRICRGVQPDVVAASSHRAWRAGALGRGVQPDVVAASMMWPGTERSPIIV